MLVQTLFKPEEHNNDLLRNEYISQELNYNIATISFMSRGLDNLQATKLRWKMKSTLEKIYFEIPRGPSEIPANQPGQFSLSGQIFLLWAAGTRKGHLEFQNNLFRPLFTIIFKPRMVILRLKILVHFFWLF